MDTRRWPIETTRDFQGSKAYLVIADLYDLQRKDTRGKDVSGGVLGVKLHRPAGTAATAKVSAGALQGQTRRLLDQGGHPGRPLGKRRCSPRRKPLRASDQRRGHPGLAR